MAAAATGDEPAPSPDQQALERWLDHFVDAGRASSDLRLRMALSAPGMEQRADGMWIAVETVPTSTLYEQARGSTDPLVLDLLLTRCALPAARPPCDRLDIARRWTAVDTGNMVAWLALAAVHRGRGDVQAARAAVLRASQAFEWHDHYNDIARLIAKAIPVDADARQRNAALHTSLRVAGTGIPFHATQTLSAFCHETGPSREACLRIIDVMVRDGDTLISQTLSAPLAARANASEQAVTALRTKSDALHWASTQLARAQDDIEDQETLDRRNAELQTRVEQGERASDEVYLRASHLSDREAAARFVATLSPGALKMREAMTRQAREAALSADSARSTAASP